MNTNLKATLNLLLSFFSIVNVIYYTLFYNSLIYILEVVGIN